MNKESFHHTTTATVPAVRSGTITKPALPAEEHEATALKARKQVRAAGSVGIFIGIMTALAVLSGAAGMEPVNLIDAGIAIALAVGVFCFSRVCATLLLLHFIAGKIIMWSLTGSLNGLPFAILFAIVLAFGVSGTFTHHRLKRSIRRAG